MSTSARNSHGLFDSPVRSLEKENIVLTQEDLERQLEAGAFAMSREEAIMAGFLHPNDELHTVTVKVVELRKEDI